MARAGTTVSSLPAADEDLELEDIPEEGEEIELTADEIAANEEAALEESARRQGWRPLAEYKGKPGGWKSARQFIEDGQNYLPFVQKELRESKDTIGRMSGEMEELRTLVASTQSDMRKLLDFSRKANQAGYDRAVADLKAEQREAVAAGDTAKYDQIETQLDEMEEARGEPEPTAPIKDPEPRPSPKAALEIPQEYQDFMAENGWFNTDRVLNTAMIAEHNAIIEESPGLSLADQLEKAKEAVMARFPKKFGLDEAPPAPPKKRPAAPLPPSGQRPRGPAEATGINSITDPQERAEARRGFATAKKSMPTLTEAEYLDIWNNPHADVLDVIAAHKPSRK